jgi:hypothetical protein
MDIEFHYYMTHLIALRAGFKKEDALKIAYSSQYTDDNDEEFTIRGGDAPYNNLISQTSDIQKPQEERLSIYPIFHFCPGTNDEISKYQTLREDGARNPLTTIPDNSNARRIFADAIKTVDLYRIGIGTHMYGDTFCHRDFSGWKDKSNWIQLHGFVGELWDAVGPAIGHALAMHNPDIPPLVWEDTRLTSKYRLKKNKEQILLAAGNIFDFYCELTKPGKEQSDIRNRLLGELSDAIGNEAEIDSTKDSRDENYNSLLGPDYVKYSERQWFDNAVDEAVDPETVGTSNLRTLTWKQNYMKSDWFLFQKAVRQHHDVAMNVLKDTFVLMGIEEKILAR